MIIHTDVWIFEALHAMLVRSGFEVGGISRLAWGYVGGATPAPDVAILQVQEPVSAHRGLADEVRRRWPESALLVVGGKAADVPVDHGARLLRARCVLRRPFSQRVLAQLVREAIE